MKTKKILPQIEHLVVLMLENRSLDAVCGWLYEKDEPQHVIGRDIGCAYDGLVEGKYWNELYWQGQLQKFPVVKAKSENPKIPSENPHEEYLNVNDQLYGNAKEAQKQTPPFGKPASMKGFLRNHSENDKTKPWEVLQCYCPKGLPVLNGLARSYAISDRWFSSVPTQTSPNRAFFTCGTSLGREKNGPLSETYPIRTLWHELRDHKVEWTTYYHDLWPPPFGKKCYTHFTFPETGTLHNPSGRKTFAPIAEFFSAAKAGQLPPFTFLEPKWSYGKGIFVVQGNDYHPPASVAPAEAFVQQVYASLTSHSGAWSKTLLVITFDEHGGTYDHVAPPWSKLLADGHTGANGFLFDRYGVRVPTLLISPYIAKETVFRSSGELEYDHVSLTATILKWAGIDPQKVALGKRVKVAPTFEDVLGDVPRSDVPVVSPPADVPSPTLSAEQSAQLRRFEALPPPVGKALAERAIDEADLVRQMELYEQTGILAEGA